MLPGSAFSLRSLLLSSSSCVRAFCVVARLQYLQWTVPRYSLQPMTSKRLTRSQQGLCRDLDSLTLTPPRSFIPYPLPLVHLFLYPSPLPLSLTFCPPLLLSLIPHLYPHLSHIPYPSSLPPPLPYPLSLTSTPTSPISLIPHLYSHLSHIPYPSPLPYPLSLTSTPTSPISLIPRLYPHLSLYPSTPTPPFTLCCLLVVHV